MSPAKHVSNNGQLIFKTTDENPKVAIELANGSLAEVCHHPNGFDMRNFDTGIRTMHRSGSFPVTTQEGGVYAVRGEKSWGGFLKSNNKVLRANMPKKPKIVVIGGGTGTFTVLSGLRDYPVDLTAIITMADSGGSNRVLRDEFGILPTSDIRQAIVALADDEDERKVFRDLFTYRFHQGTGIAGMTFGNLFMAALSDLYGSQTEAIKKTCEVLKIKGRILPVSLDDVQLVARYENGHQVVGEHFIDEPRHDGKLKIVEMETIPQAKIFPEAEKVILAADLIILGPGDLYTSLICNLVVQGVPEALKKTKAKVLFVMNLMARYGQTYRMTARDHLQVLEKYLGPGVIDIVLLNESTKYAKRILNRYREEKSYPVKDDLGNPKRPKVIRERLLSGKVYNKAKGDNLYRSMIRHDSAKLAEAIMKIARG